MHSAAAWAAGVLSLANAGLALALLVPLHRARRAGRLDRSLIASRVGLAIEVGLGIYVGAALVRGSLTMSVAVGADSALTAVQNWGMISGSASVLVLLVALRWYLAPLLNSLQRSQQALAVMLGAFEPGSLNPEDLDLSTREREVLAVIAAGRVSDQEIADALFISTATAATHVRNILKKAGLHDRRQLVLIGLQDLPR
jgi:DNA-binding CsgD family transcriptional regulator